MSIAIIKGKLSRSGSEDLMTASVFGALRYIPHDLLLIPILKKAKSTKDINFSFTDHINDKQLNISFWPQYNGVEPDLELTFPDNRIFIEVKFHSAMSGDDQLTKQFEQLRILPGKVKRLIYLTKHRTMPKNEIQKSIDLASEDYKEDFCNSLFWISWFDIWEVCNERLGELNNIEHKYKYIIVKDIVDLLERQNLAHFTGFKFDIITSVLPTNIQTPIFYNHE